jgi:hypothetical protein
VTFRPSSAGGRVSRSNELVLHCGITPTASRSLTPFSTASDGRLGITPIQDWRRRFDSKYAALCFRGWT